MGFVISSPFLPILLTSFPIGTKSVIHFSVFCSKQLNYNSNSSASYFMIKL